MWRQGYWDVPASRSPSWVSVPVDQAGSGRVPGRVTQSLLLSSVRRWTPALPSSTRQKRIERRPSWARPCGDGTAAALWCPRRRAPMGRSDVDPGDPLGFLVRDGHAASLPDAAYRFCREELGTHVILSGTGSLDHLRENIASFHRPPLPPDIRQRLVEIFAHSDSVTGQ